MMDRPLGPRQPDKRTTAYESIFGRPSVSHASGSSTPQNYPPPPGYSPGQYPYPSNQQHYSPVSHDLPNSPYSSHTNDTLTQSIYPLPPDDPTDPNLESLHHQGHPPTHAYQPQTYPNNAIPH